MAGVPCQYVLVLVSGMFMLSLIPSVGVVVLFLCVRTISKCCCELVMFCAYLLGVVWQDEIMCLLISPSGMFQYRVVH